jgi:hypothetical protein
VSWQFDFRRGAFTKDRYYEDEALDVYALVALNPQKVLFTFPNGKKQMTITDEKLQAMDSLKNTENLFKELRCRQTP